MVVFGQAGADFQNGSEVSKRYQIVVSSIEYLCGVVSRLCGCWAFKKNGQSVSTGSSSLRRFTVMRSGGRLISVKNAVNESTHSRRSSRFRFMQVSLASKYKRGLQQMERTMHFDSQSFCDLQYTFSLEQMNLKIWDLE